jgi:hypothetical protein
MSMTFNNNATIFRKALEKQFCNKAHKTITKLHKERDFVRGGKGKILFVTEICKTSKQILPGCLLAFFFLVLQERTFLQASSSSSSHKLFCDKKKKKKKKKKKQQL